MDEHDMWDGFFDETPAEEPETEVEETEAAEEPVADEDANSDIGGGDPTSTETEDVPDNHDGNMEEPVKNEGGFTAEMQAAIDAEAQKRVDAAIARQFQGMTNPFTGQPIKTERDLIAYREAYEEAEQRKKFEEFGVDEKMLNDFVNKHPAIQRANRLIQEQQQTQAIDMMQKDFKALQEEFPDSGLKEVGDLLKTEEGRKALNIWKNNKDVTMADAYAMTHRAQIKQRAAEARQREAEALKQGMRNQMNSKNHLTQTKGSAGGGDEIPAQALEGLKEFFPGRSYAEYLAMYKKNNK